MERHRIRARAGGRDSAALSAVRGRTVSFRIRQGLEPGSKSSALVASRRRAADRARIADIDTQILAIQRSILALQSERDLVQERLDSYVYPVLTLPIEITSKIFSQFLPLYPQSSGGASPSPLPRSGEQYICTSQTPRPPRQRVYQVTWPTSLNVWKPSLWEHLHAEWMTGTTPSFLGDPMPLLRQVEVLFSTDRKLVTLGNAPLLRSASVTCYTVFPTILPWTQLTTLKLRGFFWEFTPILQHTVHLVHCGPAFDIQIQSLQSFRLMVDDSEEEDGHASNPEYLTSFNFPSLHTLQIPDEFLKADFIATLVSFMSISRCALQRLYITGKRTAARAAYRRALSIPEVSFHRTSTEPVHDSDEEDPGTEPEEDDAGGGESETE
ncbi:hypothetical protein GGX14DRAFT_396342 [Mycena pura]|uniref:F-box domain-containing protein n=1 Tax=Mycena pura TaxID=153505 RepID=A0AAD6YBJ9_9AGAR|nr:hypothetical protein GGX14DRAFT_396342 [Mycena pura]